MIEAEYERLKMALRDAGDKPCAEVLTFDLREILNYASMTRFYARELTSAELKLVDKHCDWVAFKHAFNCVMKARFARTDPPREDV